MRTCPFHSDDGLEAVLLALLGGKTAVGAGMSIGAGRGRRWLLGFGRFCAVHDGVVDATNGGVESRLKRGGRNSAPVSLSPPVRQWFWAVANVADGLVWSVVARTATRFFRR